MSDTITMSETLATTLRRHFGYSSFKPLQEEIIRRIIAGDDVFALLPTGGGKSLCYQLPALLRPGLTVVVSPLIALMKDQVDGLRTNGIPATFLNSSLNGMEIRRRTQELDAGRCKLLYVAPERLMMPDFLECLRRWQVGLLAIDEAHCISEWGHDFRPEYRQLARLRTIFPGVPLAAFTATATLRVRGDIVEQLKLRKPKCFVAGFNRPNLSYRVIPKRKPEEQALALIRRRPQESGIVYCQARKTTEELAFWLRDNGVKALPYHAGLPPEKRTEHQELFRRDDIQVICATIAFGMGVNKPNVRFVIHYDLPKNIEGYYQETGRAGRDGLPSECLLLFGAGDIIKQRRFIEDKPSPQEAAVALEQLQRMAEYAESGVCRRLTLLKYFGEDFNEQNCQNCDICLDPREEFDGTIPAQKFMSCIYRLRQHTPGFGAGLRYVAEVLRGEPSELIGKWRHSELTTYGIGKDLSRKAWQDVGQELLRLGLILQKQTGAYSALELTAEGLRVLSAKQPLRLRRSVGKSDETVGPGEVSASGKATAKHGAIECDEALFGNLRALRKKIADARQVPAYVIFSDATLREMARAYPHNQAEFAAINGIGEQKQRTFAEAFLAEINEFLRTHQRRQFDAPRPIKKFLNATVRMSLRMHDDNLTVAKIARERNLTEDTIWKHLWYAAEAGEHVDLNRYLNEEQKTCINAAFAKTDSDRLKDVYENLGGEFPYGLLRLCGKQRRK
jgi:ATP-dependent DNA helicase RecQ